MGWSFILFWVHAQKELGVTWDVDLYGELLKIGGGKERYELVTSFHYRLNLLKP